MKKDDQSFGERLIEKLRENVELVCSKMQKGEPEKKFADGRERLFNLLCDHPYFQKRVAQLRKKYKIPLLGFADSQGVYHWEHEKKARYNRFVNEIDLFILDFTIPKVYRSSAACFFYDFVLSPSRTVKSSIGNYPIFSLIQADDDREINKYLIDPNGFYVQIFEWTTERDVSNAMKKIMKNKKKNLFHVSKVEGMARTIWLLSQGELSDKEIRSALKAKMDEFGDQKIPDQSNISNYRQRYERALSFLRPLD